jgi:FkbM family methyltransferase
MHLSWEKRMQVRSTLLESLVWPAANKIMAWRRLHGPEVKLPYRLFGDRVRFQWPLLTERISSDSILYSFGIGDNASFESEVIQELGLQVCAFDPTPRSRDWVQTQSWDERFRFIELGIGGSDTEVRLFPPRRSDHVSYSVLPTTGSEEGAIKARLCRLSTIMAMLGHDRLDVLKMDVEGAELPVVEDLAATDIRPDQLLIEYHHGFYGIESKDVRRSVEKVRSMGYTIFWVSDRGLEYAFVRKGRI